jgi:hypothetical protein
MSEHLDVTDYTYAGTTEGALALMQSVYRMVDKRKAAAREADAREKQLWVLTLEHELANMREAMRSMDNRMDELRTELRARRDQWRWWNEAGGIATNLLLFVTFLVTVIVIRYY